MKRSTLIRGIVGGALVVAGTAGIVAATRSAGRLHGLSSDWWRHPPPRRRCFRTKTEALRVFRDANQRRIGDWGGMDARSSRGEFDAINTRYIRRLRGKPAATIAEAFWAAMPPGPPYCLDELDLEALNETSPGQGGQGFRLPDWMEDARTRAAEAAYYAER